MVIQFNLHFFSTIIDDDTNQTSPLFERVTNYREWLVTAESLYNMQMYCRKIKILNIFVQSIQTLSRTR